MAGGRGGARPGAGRPRNEDKYADQIASFHDRVAADIEKRYERLSQLADGGWEQVEETWEAAGTLTILVDEVLPDGRVVGVRRPAFPKLPPEQLVCVKKVSSTAAPDVKAGIYLVDRLAGKPVAVQEVSGPGGESLIPQSFVDAAKRIYGGGGDSDGA